MNNDFCLFVIETRSTFVGFLSVWDINEKKRGIGEHELLKLIAAISTLDFIVVKKHVRYIH